MNLEALERFVMDTIDLIFSNPGEYEDEAVKSTIAYRFSLHRGPTIKVHHIDPKLLDIEKPKVHRLEAHECQCGSSGLYPSQPCRSFCYMTEMMARGWQSCPHLESDIISNADKEATA